MRAIDFDVHSPAVVLPQPRMVPEYKLLGLEIEQLRLPEYDANGFLLDLPAVLHEVLDDLEVGLLVLGQQGLDLGQVLEGVDAEDLVQEFDGVGVVVF